MNKLVRLLAGMLLFVTLFHPLVLRSQGTTALAPGGVDPALVERAKLGDATAQFELSVIYRKGLGVPKDQAMAASWHAAGSGSGHS